VKSELCPQLTESCPIAHMYVCLPNSVPFLPGTSASFIGFLESLSLKKFEGLTEYSSGIVPSKHEALS
jgi:hypothetical protein